MRIFVDQSVVCVSLARRWQYVGEAWGWDSREYAESLVRNKQYDALGRFERNDLEDAIKQLRAHGLFHAYFDSDALPQWVADKLKEPRHIKQKKGKQPSTRKH